MNISVCVLFLQKTIIIISMKIIMKNACIVSDSCGLLKNENNCEV